VRDLLISAASAKFRMLRRCRLLGLRPCRVYQRRNRAHCGWAAL